MVPGSAAGRGAVSDLISSFLLLSCLPAYPL
jgi:hypothetical protein